MSHEASGYVFGLKLPANEKWLLVCLANYADEWGDSVFPSLDELEDKSGMSRATLKRTYGKLIERGCLERVAESTPVSPAFYRIVGVPVPPDPKRASSCPVALRRAVLYVFAGRCEYCGRVGSKELDPDDKPWNVDRVVPASRGGGYNADNVTLACRACNSHKRAKPAPARIRTLADLQHDKQGVQVEPSCTEVPTVQVEPSPEFKMETPAAQFEPSGGFTVSPDPLIDPVKDPLSERAGAPPRPPEIPDENVQVITKLVHETLELWPRLEDADLAEAVKSRCARLHIAYDGGTVGKAIDSARWQRAHRTPVTA